MVLLIADDDRDAAETLADLLRLLVPSPLEILMACDGEEALAVATACNPRVDALVMDIEMPRMDGVNAAIAIRNALGKAAPTIIAVTGHVGMSRHPRVTSNFDHALLKPVKVDELLGLIRSL